jgi:cell division protein ZapA
MSNVHLAIGGRQFTVACAAGEEDHVADLGSMIASKIDAMGDLSNQSESRMLLFAALLLADELHDATSRGGGATAAPPPAASPASARRLEAIAERLENLATRLEG